MKTRICALSLILATGPVLAQESDDAQRRAEPTTTSPMETADEIAQRMFAGGGSLLEAQLAERRRAAAELGPTADASALSFFTVPEPEPTVLRPHDLVTVIVREESVNRSSGSTETEKSFEIDAQLREYLGLELSSLALESKQSDLALDGDAERAFEGSGSADRRDSFVTRITAEVLDVKPNGTIVLQARKRIVTDDDEQTILLTGICRAVDIGLDNTILSTQLHDLTLEKHTTGPIRDATRRGLIPRVIDWINPF
jgi:flagellar L-ring protein precursor FlgH